MHNIKLSELNVQPYFQFNRDFRKKFRVAVNKNRRHSLTNATEAISHSIENPLFNRTNKTNYILKDAIENIKKLKYVISPLEKMEVLYNTNKKIVESIDHFWRNYEIKREKLIIDPDSLLSIYIYLIIKSNQAHMIVEYEIMELFMTESQKIQEKSYYHSTLGVAINYLLNPDLIISTEQVLYIYIYI